MGRPRPSLAFKESLPRPKHHFHCPPSLVQPTTTRRRGERKGSPLFCDPCFFARNFLPAHSCVITGSAGREGEGGQCRACQVDGRTDGDGGRDIVCPPPAPPHDPRLSPVARSDRGLCGAPLFCHQLNPIDRMTFNSTRCIRVCSVVY